MKHKPTSRNDSAPWLAKWGMLICSLAIIAPIAIAIIFGNSLTTISGNLWIIVPLAVCLGLHFVLHRLSGKSCHMPDATAHENPAQSPKS